MMNGIPKVPFCSHKWPDSKNHVHASLLNDLAKLDQIISFPKVVLK